MDIGERKAKEVRPNTPHHTAGIRNGSGHSERTIFAGTARAGSECLLYSHREPLTDPLYRMMWDDTESCGLMEMRCHCRLVNELDRIEERGEKRKKERREVSHGREEGE